MSPLRTFIVEDNKVIFDNLVSTLEELANVEVIGHAVDEQGAVQWLSQGDRFDLMIVDIFLLSGSGLGVLKAAQDAQVPARRVVLTNYATADIRQRCRDAKVVSQAMVIASPNLGARHWPTLAKSKLYDASFTHRFRKASVPATPTETS